MKKFKIIIILLTIAFFAGCEKVTQNIEQKINDKINKTVDENLNKVDSVLSGKSGKDTLKKNTDNKNIPKDKKSEDKGNENKETE